MPRTKPNPAAGTGGVRQTFVSFEQNGPADNKSPNLAAQVRGGRRSRRKGDRVERELVEQHKALGIHAERYPLSGASRFRGSGHDLDIYACGREQAPLVCEVKARKGGAGFAQLERWLGEYDALFLRRNNADPLVLLPWRIWARLIQAVKR
jgi:hypothetical protein